MNIVADQNIPLLHELFGSLGDIISLPGRTLQASDLAEADILLVRSITQVNAALLEGTPVRFVGSCTIGIDHLDTAYLDKKNIMWSNAPGCNANAVVQYVMSAMAAIKPQWHQQKIGIVGCGNIGSRLYHRLTQLGVDCSVYDPFLHDAHIKKVDALEDILDCDIITLHTPLTRSGEYPTYHLFNQNILSKLKDSALLINSGRGAVIDNQALLKELERRPLSVVLDVWENEPDIDRALLEKINLGTPHIAGYSVEGKEMGSYQVYKALCQYLDLSISEDSQNHLSRDTQEINITSECFDKDISKKENALNQLLLHCYNIQKDDTSLRANTDFDQLRKNYLTRREYTHFTLTGAAAESLVKPFAILAGKSE